MATVSVISVCMSKVTVCNCVVVLLCEHSGNIPVLSKLCQVSPLPQAYCTSPCAFSGMICGLHFRQKCEEVKEVKR